MFYLKKVMAEADGEEAGEKLRLLGRKLSAAGIAFCMENEEKPDSGSGTLWITDSPARAQELIKDEKPLLVYLHSGSRDSSFPMAGFAMEEPQELEAEYLERVYRRFAGIPWDIAVTPRCIVREMIPEDAPYLEALYQEEGARRFLGGLYTETEPGEEAPDLKPATEPGKEAPRPEAAWEGRKYIEEYIQKIYGFYGYGIWSVLCRETGTIIGRAGFRAGGEVPEVGYMIGEAWQRKGLAFEVCQALLDYGKNVLGFSKVQAKVVPENLPSLSLLKKLGFTEAKTPHTERPVESGGADGRYICLEKIF